MLEVESSDAFRSDIAAVSPALADDLSLHRPKVKGKYLFVGDTKLWIRGATYGTFHPDEDGNEYHDPQRVERDFAQMADNGLHAIRTYTVPPRWLLDAAQHHGLRVMVGLPWEQHENASVLVSRPALVTRLSSAMRLAMRFQPLSCAGMETAAWNSTLSACTGLPRMRIRKGWSPM